MRGTFCRTFTLHLHKTYLNMCCWQRPVAPGGLRFLPPYPKKNRVWVGSKSEIRPRCDCWLKGSTNTKVIQGTVSRRQLPSSYSLPTNAILLGKPTSVKNPENARKFRPKFHELRQRFAVSLLCEICPGRRGWRILAAQISSDNLLWWPWMPISKWHRGVSSLLRLWKIDED